MGNLCSVSISIDNLLNNCCISAAQQVKYVTNLEENIETLKTALEELKELRNDILHKVEDAERRQMRRLEQVEGWFSRVQAIESDVRDLIKDSQGDKIKTRCVVNCCSRHFLSAYRLGKRVVKKVKDVNDLQSKGNFTELVSKLPATPVDPLPSEPTVGTELIFSKIWSHIQEEDAGIISLYGLGGVGKTTLLKRINNQFASTDHDYAVVMWVVVSKEPSISRIQDDIAERLGLYNDEWTTKNQLKKAAEIFRVLSDRKFVLLLDDIWQRFDLSKIGVPLPDTRNKCKVIFTTRSKDMFCGSGSEGPKRRIKVECLPWDKAWELFNKMVGQEILDLHPDIPELARTVVEECAGLPLALITVGRAMSCKETPQEWEHAIQLLKESSDKFSDMVEEVLVLLNFSYENLRDDTTRSCFLYCCLFPEDHDIFKEDLIDYWIGENLIESSNNAQNKGYDIIGTLLHACLLEEGPTNYVKMHDVVRDMALWIATEHGSVPDNYLVAAGQGLTESPEVSRWEKAKRISLMYNNIREINEDVMCTNLQTLLLYRNDLMTINKGVFAHMQALRVLDLSWNFGIVEFPSGICELLSLQYLDISSTNMTQLPLELRNLVNLKCLVMEHMSELQSIPSNVISCLTSLRVLKMFACGWANEETGDGVLGDGNESFVDELNSLKHLNYLTATITSASAFERISSSTKLQSRIRRLSFQVLNDSTCLNISFLKYMKHLGGLLFSHCQQLQDVHVDRNQLEGNCLFGGLSFVRINSCTRLKNLNWLVFLPRLYELRVVECDEMEEIISDRWMMEATEDGEVPNPFGELQIMQLNFLPQLKSIYPSALPFPCLTDIEVRQCPMLKRLPLHSKSGKGKDTKIQGDNDWLKNLEWEDQATRMCFFPGSENGDISKLSK